MSKKHATKEVTLNNPTLFLRNCLEEAGIELKTDTPVKVVDGKTVTGGSTFKVDIPLTWFDPNKPDVRFALPAARFDRWLEVITNADGNTLHLVDTVRVPNKVAESTWLRRQTRSANLKGLYGVEVVQ